jgi:hypothetical protein
MREREDRTLPFAFRSEEMSLPTIREHVAPNSTIYADEASCWDALHARYLAKRINHSEAYSTDESCTNQAESFFSRLRRAEIGIHHHIPGAACSPSGPPLVIGLLVVGISRLTVLARGARTAPN